MEHGVATLGLFVIVELIAAQLVEPQLYGHTTGLSPLSVVIAAIFWSWLWGPIGLIVSTPLTLCLLVAGRHIKALSLLDILLGDTQALTLPQRFYQRALSADSDEIIARAREFLKRNSFANYCDLVLLPACTWRGSIWSREPSAPNNKPGSAPPWLPSLPRSAGTVAGPHADGCAPPCSIIPRPAASCVSSASRPAAAGRGRWRCRQDRSSCARLGFHRG